MFFHVQFRGLLDSSPTGALQVQLTQGKRDDRDQFKQES
jgi:hypothetical protein